MTVSAATNSSMPHSVASVNPPTARSGAADSAHTFSSYHGTSNSGRGRPKTSTTQPSSNGDMPSNA